MKLMIPEFMQAAMNDFVHPSIKQGEWYGIPIFYLEVLASMHVYPLSYNEEEHKLYLNYGNDTISTTITPDKNGYMDDSIKWFTTEMIKQHDNHEYVFLNDDACRIPIFKNGCMEFFPKDPNNHAEEVACLIDQVITLYKIIMDLGDTINTLRSHNKESNEDDLKMNNYSSDAENKINTDNQYDEPVEHLNHFDLDKKDQLINSLSESNHALIMRNRELSDNYDALFNEYEKLKESVKNYNNILADYEKLKDDYNTLSDINTTLTKLNKKYEEKSAIEDKIAVIHAKKEELYNKSKDNYKSITNAFVDFLVDALNSNKNFKKTSNIIHSTPSDINNDNNDLQYSTNVERIGLTKIGYYNLGWSITHIDPNGDPDLWNTGICVIIPCSPGDVFSVTSTGTAAARNWAFLSSDNTNNIIMRKVDASNQYVCDGEIITAPSNASYAVFNANKYYNVEICKSKPVALQIEEKISGEITNLEVPLATDSHYTTIIPANSDLNSYQTPGNYKITTITIAETVANIPEIVDGRLTVFTGATDTNFIQLYIGSNSNTYIRVYYSNAWQDWTKIDNKYDLVQTKTKNIKKTKYDKFVVYIKRSDIGIACLDNDTCCMYDPLDGSIISTDVNEENYTIFNINGCAVKFIKHLLNDLNGEDNDWK